MASRLRQLGNLNLYPQGCWMVSSAWSKQMHTSTTLPGWKGKTDSCCSAPQAPPSLLLHTMVLVSPCSLKRGLKCRHRLLPSLPRFSTKLLVSRATLPSTLRHPPRFEIQVADDKTTNHDWGEEDVPGTWAPVVWRLYRRALVLKEWCSLEAILCGPEVQSPLATRTRHSMAIPHVGCRCPPAVIGLWLLYGEERVGVTCPSWVWIDLCVAVIGLWLLYEEERVRVTCPSWVWIDLCVGWLELRALIRLSCGSATTWGWQDSVIPAGLQTRR